MSTLKRHAIYCLLALCQLVGASALACETDSDPIFACEAADGRKFIELCSSSPPAADGFLQYRFGTMDQQGDEKATELTYPESQDGSMKRFFGATYTHQGVYTQSVRFLTKTHSYTVFTRARGQRDEGAGVEVRALATGKLTTIYCSERPRFYIFDLQGLLACDPDTPAGKACIK